MNKSGCMSFSRNWLGSPRGGRQVIVERSGHGIPDDAPEVVLDAVREVVIASRGALK
jgi:hypothetical protein